MAAAPLPEEKKWEKLGALFDTVSPTPSPAILEASDVFPAFARRLQRSIRSWLINGCMDGFGIWRMAA